ncbi:MAG: hypothetical protein ACO2OW_00160 [Minisyncoccia bacterium]|mgnify:CR=1 FL=1
MKLESGPEKSFTIERAEEIRQEIEEVLALIDSGEVSDENFKSKLRRLKTCLSELARHHIIRIKAKEIITKIETPEQYQNLQQIYSLLQELKERLSNILDNLKNFLLNLNLAKSAFENPEVWEFVPEDSPEKHILLYICQTIERVLREFPKYEDIETKESREFSNFNEFLDYLIERIIEALKALEGLEGIKNKEKKLEISLTLYARLLELILLRTRGVDKRKSLR